MEFECAYENLGPRQVPWFKRTLREISN